MIINESDTDLMTNVNVSVYQKLATRWSRWAHKCILYSIMNIIHFLKISTIIIMFIIDMIIMIVIITIGIFIIKIIIKIDIIIIIIIIDIIIITIIIKIIIIIIIGMIIMTIGIIIIIIDINIEYLMPDCWFIKILKTWDGSTDIRKKSDIEVGLYPHKKEANTKLNV